MQIPKLKVLVEAGVVRAVEASYANRRERAGRCRSPTPAGTASAARSWSGSAAGCGCSPPWTPWRACLAGLGLTGVPGRRRRPGRRRGRTAVNRGLLLALLAGRRWRRPGRRNRRWGSSSRIARCSRPSARWWRPTSRRAPARRVLEHTSVYVRAASGTSSTVSESGDTTTSSPMTVGIQVNIPLASPREQREFAQQALAEATRIDEVRSRALTDLAKLRELEAERAAVRERLDFQKSKADWVQERIRKGYEGDVEKLWESAQKQNAEAAAVKRLDLLIDAQRRQVAHYAGEQWPPLLDYLSGKPKQLPEG
ncbi:MAG: hypothetical protein MZV65_15445 [Chromatiales bacterium]|nr:hypothetical protein [Chromatiales bacterium]